VISKIRGILSGGNEVLRWSKCEGSSADSEGEVASRLGGVLEQTRAGVGPAARSRQELAVCRRRDVYKRGAYSPRSV
jgi:hypothetical protein